MISGSQRNVDLYLPSTTRMGIQSRGSSYNRLTGRYDADRQFFFSKRSTIRIRSIRTIFYVLCPGGWVKVGPAKVYYSLATHGNA